MNEIIATLIIIGAFVYYIRATNTVKISLDVMVPRDIQKGAQHAADVSQRSQVVVFDGSTFDIMRADNQHAARGQIMMVFHPKQDTERAPRNICVGSVLKPNPRIDVTANSLITIK